MELKISEDRWTITAPCGCTFRNTYHGMLTAKEHDHEKDGEVDAKDMA